MIRRSIDDAASGTHDVLVVGGGVQGIAVTLEAARRGLRVVLLERDDFGGRTSWNSLRIVHGGLRYLQSLDLRRFAESVRERRWFLTRFPDLVRPLPCLMPLYGSGLRRPAVLRAVFAADARLSSRRNDGVRADRRLPAGRVLSAKETLERFPQARPDRLLGGALWHDAVMPDPTRVLMAMLRWAVARGAIALNYVAADRPIVERGRIVGVEAVDRRTERAVAVHAPTVILCAGPWNGPLADRFGARPTRPDHSMLAFNVFLDRDPGFDGAVAVAPPTPGARTYFAYPSKGGLLAGTYQAPWTEGPDAGPPSVPLLESCLADLRAAVPAFDAGPRDIVRTHWGLLPARARGSVRLTTRPAVVRHADHAGPEGLYGVTAIKFTTSRLVAETVLRLVHRDLRRPLPDADDASPPVVTGPPDLATLRELWERDPDRARDRIRAVVESEAVLEAEDLTMRRTDWAQRPDDLANLDPALRDFLETVAAEGGPGPTSDANRR